MQKRLLFLIILSLFLMPIAYGDDGPEQEGSGGDTGKEFNAEQTKVELQKTDPNADLSADAKGESTSDGSVKISSASSVTYKGVTYTGVKNMVIDSSGKVTMEQGTEQKSGAKFFGAEDIESSGDGYKAASVGSLQQGPIVITNGKNVKYENGCLTADSADSLVETDTVATNLDTVEYCDKKIDVKEADSVWAGCVYMEDVENAEITAKTDVEITADEDSDFSIKDCATNQYDFKALSDDAKLIVSKNTVEPTLELQDVFIELEKNNVTESVETNSTAEIVVSRIDGMQIIRMKPVTIYHYDANDPERDFSVRAWQSDHDLFLRKSQTDQLPVEVKTCTQCSIFDFPNHALEIRGVIDFNKPQLKKVGASEPLAFFATANANAKALLTFDKDNAFVNDILILNDAPPYKTVISNYLTIEEAIQRGDKTERLLDIDETVTKDTITRSWVTNYRTAYSPSTMKIDDNELSYQRNGVILTVYPPGHSKIASLLKDLTSAHAMLFASLAGLIALPLLGRKRGQITVFMLLGVIMLAAVMFLLAITLPSQVHIKNQDNVQEFVSNCLKLSGDASLTAFGLQGGHLALQAPFYQTPPTAYDFNQGTNNLLPLERMELDLGEDAKNRVITCLDNFDAFTGVTVETLGSPTVKAILGLKETTFTLDYRFFVTKADQRWEFKDFAATVPKGALNIINAANATIQSEVQNDGKINLDQLPSATYTFFPGESALLALIEGSDFKFFFANKR